MSEKVSKWELPFEPSDTVSREQAIGNLFRAVFRAVAEEELSEIHENMDFQYTLKGKLSLTPGAVPSSSSTTSGGGVGVDGVVRGFITFGSSFASEGVVVRV